MSLKAILFEILLGKVIFHKNAMRANNACNNSGESEEVIRFLSRSLTNATGRASKKYVLYLKHCRAFKVAGKAFTCEIFWDLNNLYFCYLNSVFIN